MRQSVDSRAKHAENLKVKELKTRKAEGWRKPYEARETIIKPKLEIIPQEYTIKQFDYHERQKTPPKIVPINHRIEFMPHLGMKRQQTKLF